MKTVYINKFNKTLLELIEDLRSIFPKETQYFLKGEPVEKNIQENLDIDQYSNEFYTNVMKVALEFSQKNEVVFSSDITLIPYIDFNYIWNHTTFNEHNEKNMKIKDNIWKYLHSLFLYTYCSNHSKNLKDIISDYKLAKSKIDPEQLEETPKILFGIIDNLYHKRKIENKEEGEDDIFKDPKDDENQKSGMPDLSGLFKNMAGNLGNLGDLGNLGNLGDLGNLGNLGNGDPSKIAESMFGGKIGQLACDIAKDIDPSSLDLNLENPGDLLNPLLSGLKGDTSQLESSPIFGIVNQITEKLQTKLNSGEVDEKELFNEATDMIDNLGIQGDKKPKSNTQVNPSTESPVDSKHIALDLLKKKRKNRKKIIRNKKKN